MVGALLLLLVGVPLGLYAANSINGYLSANPTYVQIENTTAFYEAPFIADDVDTEGRYAAVNGTTITVETPVWDTTGEWDALTITNDETRNTLYFNVNITVKELLNTDYSKMRLKFNGTKHLAVTIYAVKFDGVVLTKVSAVEFAHVGNESSTVYWNMTPSALLQLQTGLAPALTDEVYLQIAVSGYNAANALEVGDTVMFQFAWASASAVYSFTSWQILTFMASGMGFVLILVAMGSTAYWNPLAGKKGSRSSGSPLRRSSRKKRSNRRRR